MAKTFDQYCDDMRDDMLADGLYESQDFSIFFDIAGSMLYNPEFRKLAESQFPGGKDRVQLCEFVAHSIC